MKASSTIRKAYFLLGDQGKKLPFYIVLFLGLSMLDLLALSAIGSYVGMIINNEEGITSNAISKFLYTYQLDRNTVITIYGAVIFSIFIVKALCSVLILKKIASFSSNLQVDLRGKLSEVYTNMSYISRSKRTASDFIFHINDLVYSFSHLIVFLGLRSVSDIIVGVIICMYLLYLNPIAFFIMVLVTSIMLVGYDSYFKSHLKLLGKQVNKYTSDFINTVNEIIFGFKEIKAYGREDFFNNKLKVSVTKYVKAKEKLVVLSAAPKYLIETMLISFVVLLITITLYTHNNAFMILPDLAVFGVASLRLLPAANGFMGAATNFRYNKDAIEKLYTDVSNVDTEKSPKEFHINKSYGIDTIEIKDLDFSYEGNPVLENINFSIKKGDVLGVSGPSGSGKSTLIDILLGFLERTNGQILVNNDIVNSSWLRASNCFGYIPQRPVIMPGSIEGNVLFGEAEALIDKAKLQSAIELAHLDYSSIKDSNVGENGVGLSGGQVQRLVIARAIYNSKEVLVLDEVTSALDESTELAVIKEMLKNHSDKIIILISHNKKIINLCNKVLDLNKR